MSETENEKIELVGFAQIPTVTQESKEEEKVESPKEDKASVVEPQKAQDTIQTSPSPQDTQPSTTESSSPKKKRIRRTRQQIEADNLQSSNSTFIPLPLEDTKEEPADTHSSFGGSEFVLDTTSEVQPKPKTSESVTNVAPETQSSQSIVIDEKAMKMLINTVFDGIAQSRGNHWKLTADESKTVVPPATRVANKYMPKILGKYMDEFTLAIAVGSIFFSKISVDIENNKRIKTSQQMQQQVIMSPTQNPIIEPSRVEQQQLNGVTNQTIEKMYPTLKSGSI